MASTSSLLRSAAATRKKIRQQEDAIQAYYWESSLQTAEDFAAYSKYLESRATSVSDPSEQLSYQSKLRSARRSYTTNEIQREQMRIMEGSGTTQTKMQAVQRLYDQAIGAGDYNLAQNLASQWNSLSIQAQNEAQSYYRTLATSKSNSLKTLTNNLIKGNEPVEMNGRLVMPLGALNEQVLTTGKLPGGVSPFAAAQDTIKAIQEAVNQALQAAPDQETVDKLAETYGGYFDGSKNIKLFGRNMSNTEIDLAVASEQANNPLFSLRSAYNAETGRQEYTLQENAVSDFTLARTGQDAEGNDLYAPIQVRRRPQDSGEFQSLDTQLTDAGETIGRTGNINLGTGNVERNDANTIKERLLRLGIQSSSGPNGTIYITLPDGRTYQATISPGGNVRYFGEPGAAGTGLYEVSLSNQDNIGPFGLSITAGIPREVAADESSIFGEASLFGGMLSQPSAAGRRTIDAYRNPNTSQIIDASNARLNGFANPLLGGQIATGNDFTGRPLPVTSQLLQSANLTLQNRIMAEEQAKIQATQQAAARLQAAPTFNLNQTPVQQFASNGMPIRQLSVARPIVPPRITVAPPVAPRAPLTVTNTNSTGQLGITGGFNGVLRVR